MGHPSIAHILIWLMLEFSNESLLLSENELELDETQVDDVYNPFIDHTFDVDYFVQCN